MTEQEALLLAQAGIDGDGILLIDEDTRSIYIPESEKFFGVESDQNVERKKFKCPKIVGDNIDLSTLHLYINYQNGNGNKDSYMIQDMAVSGEYITFSWILSRNVTAYKGTVRFIFCAKKADGSGNLTNEWNTTVAEGQVIEGLESTASVVENNPDIIEQMLTLLKNVSDEPTFVEATKRENITNGEKVPILWGKVKKWFADLGTAAFCKVVNNLTTAVDGGVLDARQGKALNDALASLNKLMGNTDISGIGNGTVTGALLTLNSKELLEVGGVIKNDFDDYRTPGAYICVDFYNVKNAPSSNHDSCFMLVFNSYKSWTIQIVFSTFRYDGIYFRRIYETTTFESWHLAKST